MRTYVFLDTNLALHYKRPDQIDWVSKTGSDKVYLVLTTRVFSELERQKIHNPSKKLRERADKFLRYVASFEDDFESPVRDHVHFTVIPTEPMIDFTQYSLNKDVQDDWLIAQALEFNSGFEQRIAFATGDTTLKLKLKHRNLDVLPMHDNERLPDDDDPTDKENRRLKAELQQLKGRIPKFDVVFSASREPFVSISFEQPPEFDQESLDRIKRQYPLRGSSSESQSHSTYALTDISAINRSIRNAGLSPESIADYDQRVQEFYQSYQKYLYQLRDWKTLVCLSHEIKLTLRNIGSAPATDIDIFIDFPDSVSFYEPEDFPDCPEEPKPPRGPDPNGFLRVTAALAEHYSEPKVTTPPIPRPQRDGDINIDSNRNRATAHVKDLKAGHEIELEPIILAFRAIEDVFSFKVSYEITSWELSEPIQGTLNFKAEN